MPGGPEGIPARFLSCPRPRAICPGVARLAKLAAGNRTRVATMMRSARLILAAVACMVVLAGCNTIKGIGKDVQKAGEAIEGAAK